MDLDVVVVVVVGPELVLAPTAHELVAPPQRHDAVEILVGRHVETEVASPVPFVDSTLPNVGVLLRQQQIHWEDRHVGLDEVHWEEAELQLHW